ncbi:MAG: hypothetical protein EHM20_12915 [Alphaproteobacteria bacterium]|nr:MAG: hypothetical protein EHM20_12915 [Alphaproteobacteria bacterium]
MYIENQTCKGNPGIGGWGVRLIVDGKARDFYGWEKFTTNNRMKLTAAITALQNSPIKPKRVKVFTNSRYTMKSNASFRIV